MVQNNRSRLILDATYIRRVLSWNRIFGCSYFVCVLNKTWTSSYKWFRVLNKTWTTSAHPCHVRDDNNRSSFCWPVIPAIKMASQSASKTPTRQRNSSTLVEEKEFLILCRELAIAEQLDNCVTSAGVIRREPFIREVRVLRKTRTYKWYSSRPI